MFWTPVHKQQQNSRKTLKKSKVWKPQQGEHLACSKHVSMNKNEIQEKLERGAKRNLCPTSTSMEAKEDKELEEKAKEWGDTV